MLYNNIVGILTILYIWFILTEWYQYMLQYVYVYLYAHNPADGTATMTCSMILEPVANCMHTE